MSDDALHDSWINRLGYLLAVPLAATGITPNQITILGAAVGLSAGALFAEGSQANANWAAGLFMVAVFLDELDGALARRKQMISRSGHILDYLCGTLSFSALFLGIGIGYATTGAGGWALALGIGAVLSAFASMTMRMRMEDDHGPKAVRYPQFGGFELKDGIYLIGPVTWVGGLAPFFVMGAIATCVFATWTYYKFASAAQVRSAVSSGAKVRK